MKPYRKLLLPILLLGIALLCTSCFSLLPPLEPLSSEESIHHITAKYTLLPAYSEVSPAVPEEMQSIRAGITGKALILRYVESNNAALKLSTTSLVRTNCYRGEEKSLATHEQTSPLLTYLFSAEILFSPIPVGEYEGEITTEGTIQIQFLEMNAETPSLECFLHPDGILFYHLLQGGYYASTTTVDVKAVNRLIDWK
ncbi:MAG: hypothetical protein IJX28_05830 [Clostridia bacterium]|nr:hypothetical protein [Clostridia bacterium]